MFTALRSKSCAAIGNLANSDEFCNVCWCQTNLNTVLLIVHLLLYAMPNSAVYWIHREADETSCTNWLNYKIAERTCSLLSLGERPVLWLVYDVMLRSDKNVSVKRPVKSEECSLSVNGTCVPYGSQHCYILMAYGFHGRWIWTEVCWLCTLDVLQGMCPMETTVMGEGIDIGPNPLPPPPSRFGVYLDVIPWTLRMEGGCTSETTVSQPKEL
jgi:hypothetical protein